MAKRHNTRRKCSIEGCDRPYTAQGYCQKHYDYKKKTGEIKSIQKRFQVGCLISGCDGKHRAKGMCNKHWRRWKNYGDAEFTKVAPTGEPLRFLLKAIKNATADKCIIWKFAAGSSGYGRVWADGRDWQAHRYALFKQTGINPPDKLACHGPCHNPSCINPHPGHGMYWGTPKENAADRLRDGTVLNGGNSNNHKLTESMVLDIRKDPRLHKVIAADFGIARQSVGEIKNKKTWVWLGDRN